MSAFGITATSVSGKTSFWVGEDIRLFEWLQNTDVEPSNLPYRAHKMRIVRPPEGFAFLYGSSLVELSSEHATEVDGAGLSNRGFVTAQSPRDDKASMVYEHLKTVTQTEFEAMNFEDGLVLSFESY